MCLYYYIYFYNNVDEIIIDLVKSLVNNYKKIESYNSLSIIEKFFYIIISVVATQLFIYIAK
jgi:hypothetical protein